MTIPFKRRLLDQIELNDHEKKNLQILDTIRKKGPIARAEISRLIGLNIVTVTSYVDQYIKKGVIKEVGVDVSSGGRKPTLVDLNPASIFSMGLGLNLTHMIAVIVNLKGEIIFTLKKERPLVSGEKLINCMVDFVEELIKESKADLKNFHGIGIGMPGPFNRDSNSIRWEAGLAQEDLIITTSIHAVFEKRFGISALVDHDATAALFGENWYGQKIGLKHAIYLYSGDGYGFLLNGEIYRGANNCAGEWLFAFSDDQLPKELEVVAQRRPWWSIDLGVSVRAEGYYEQNKGSAIYKLVANDLSKISVGTVVQAAESGDAFAKSLLVGAGGRLGKKAAFLVNLLNPEVLIVGGGVERAGAEFMDSLKDTIKKLSHPEATDKLRVIPSQLGEAGVALGAAALVAQDYFISV